MVDRQLRRRGITDERVLSAMGEVPREEFVEPGRKRRAYADSALPIGVGQTISQPWIVAAICQALELGGEERVLEVGTGLGYSACVLSRLAAEVITIERHPSLADQAQTALHRLGAENVTVRIGDGSRGWSAGAPYEGIAVHATAPAAPLTLLSQLAEGGRLVAPIVGEASDLLTVYRRRTGEEFESRVIGPCRFVPLIGEEGFDPAES